MRCLCAGESRAKSGVRSASSAELARRRGARSPRRAPPDRPACPTWLQILRLTSSLSPVRILTATPCSLERRHRRGGRLLGRIEERDVAREHERRLVVLAVAAAAARSRDRPAPARGSPASTEVLVLLAQVFEEDRLDRETSAHPARSGCSAGTPPPARPCRSAGGGRRAASRHRHQPPREVEGQLVDLVESPRSRAAREARCVRAWRGRAGCCSPVWKWLFR